MSDCIDIELELEEDTIAIINRHAERSGLPFNDALIELLEMVMEEESEEDIIKKVRG